MFLALIVYFSLGVFKPRPRPKVKVEKPFFVQSIVVNKHSYRPDVLLYAKVESTQHATLSSRVNSVVERVLVRDGQTVQKGKILIQLDQADLILALKRSKADLVDAQTQAKLLALSLRTEKANVLTEKNSLGITQRRVKRLLNLSVKKFVSQDRLDHEKLTLQKQELAFSHARKRVDTLEAQVQQNQAHIERLSAQLNVAENQIKYTRIRAPFTGVITQLSAAKGEHVSVGQMVLDMVSIHDKEVRALVPFSVTRQLESEVSSQVVAKAVLNGKEYRLKFLRLSGRVKPGQLGREAVFRVNHSDFPAVRGQVFQVLLSLPAIKNSFVLPLSALYGNDKIYVIKNGRLERQVVALMGRHYKYKNNTWFIFTSSTLHSGDRVLTSSLPNAIDGLRVSTQALIQ